MKVAIILVTITATDARGLLVYTKQERGYACTYPLAYISKHNAYITLINYFSTPERNHQTVFFHVNIKKNGTHEQPLHIFLLTFSSLEVEKKTDCIYKGGDYGSFSRALHASYITLFYHQFVIPRRHPDNTQKTTAGSRYWLNMMLGWTKTGRKRS